MTTQSTILPPATQKPEQKEPQQWDDNALGFDFWEYWLIIRKRWFFILFIAVLFLIGGVFYTAQLPKIYRATAFISVTPPRTPNLGQIKLDNFFYYYSNYLKTQLTVLQSRSIAKKVLARIPDSICLAFFGQKRENLSELSILGSLEIEHREGSDVVFIGCVGREPRHCAFIANLVVDVFIEENDKQSETNQNLLLKWLRKEIPDIEQKIYNNREALLKFEENNADVLVVSEGDSKFYGDLIARLRREWQELRITLLSLEVQYQRAREARKTGNLQALLSLDFFNESMYIQRLRQQQFELELRFQEYKLKYKNSHPKVVRLRQRMDFVNQQCLTELEIFLKRKEQAYKDLLKKETKLKAMMLKQQSQSLELKQKYLKYDRYRREAQALQKAYTSFVDKMKQLDITFSYRIKNIRRIDAAEPPRSPFKPNKFKNYMMSCFLGVLVGIALAFLIETLDERAKTVEDIQRNIDAPLFGFIPYISPKITAGNPARVVEEKDKSPIAESFRAIATSLFFSSRQRDTRCFVISSPLAKDGKTTVLCNLGITIAKSGYKVLLLDTDLRRPQLKKIFKLEDSVLGTSQLLQGEVEAEEVSNMILPNLSVITAGKLPKDPYECIYESDLRKVFDDLKSKYDYVLIDSPPLGITSDSFLLGKATQSMVLVVSIQHATKRMLKQLADRLQTLEVPVSGLVVNNSTGTYAANRSYYNYYGYYYTSYKYYYGSDNA